MAWNPTAVDRRTITFDGSLRDIAVAIGLTPEAFYRTLAQLEAEGAIDRQPGRILLT
ncbi:helix-turn-helix domain-containing protein [Bosea sp. (in: a-proteobacteria)]|uniref:helix-turn-helix domain-containing protein n=1 Tax=Bosea sp. (in: a-proteobacteria) TaxID=1871050 RepID=UPI002B48D01D|nr:helix-turn-helix domain-containing protein [Bosea sp. (in: a-proteobacteria)]WRH56129.1 MAG: helix-turn-helix domain-containing protein [Bosea sp. (in: a-proteobacteria)]